MATHKIAVMAGDGIGKEVMPEGLLVVESAARKFGVECAFTSFDWSCDHYARHGKMMPDDWFSRHTAMTDEDFEKEPGRNKLSVVINRTNHMAYHLGQLVLVK